MVKLNRIYTRVGDDGTTALGDGERLPKHHLRIAAYGTVDELSAVIGCLLAGNAPEEGEPGSALSVELRLIQNELLDVGADLCVPGEAGDRLRITPAYVERLEGRIDAHGESLADLESFLLPGGKPAAAWLHLARTVCRRAEREVSALAARAEEAGRVNPEVLCYLNRLSDLFFQMARVANDDGALDVLWDPGARPD